MAGNYILFFIDQDRDIEAKCLDALGYLPHLLFGMDPGILWVWFELCYGEVRHLQGCCLRLHAFLRSQASIAGGGRKE